MMQKKLFGFRLWDFLLVTAGCVLFALAFALFLEPNLIAPGGLSGLGMVVNHLTGFPLGGAILAMNAPLLLISFLKFGAKFIAGTLYATVLSSILIDVGMSLLPMFTQDLLLASLYGGVLLGAGMGMVFVGGATTGGSDIISKLLRLRFPHVRLGRIVLFVDALIIIICAIVFRDINLALYAAITLYVSSAVIDMIIYGTDVAVLAYIISDEWEAIGGEIQLKLERGVTYLDGAGGYTNRKKRVVLCAVRRNESAVLNELVERLDPGAFLIVTEAHQVIGYGFSPYRK